MRLEPAYLDLVQKHINFHREMERVAGWIEDRRFDEAKLSVQAHSRFHRASQALALAVMVYDRLAPIAVPA